MVMLRQLPVLGVVCGAVLALSSCSGLVKDGGDYPSKAVTMVIPYAPGGPTDTTGRALAKGMEKKLGQPVTVVNKPGASGIIALTEVAKKKPDGYTIAYTTNSPLLQPSIRKTAYTIDSFTSVGAALGGSPDVLVVSADSPWKKPTDLGRAKKRVEYAIPGIATVPHINSLLTFHNLGVEGVAVPFDGWAPSVKAVLAGDVDTAMVDPKTAMPYIKSGKLRALGVGRAQGVELAAPLANAPAMKKSGVRVDKLLTSFYGVIAPADTPQQVIKKLRNAVTYAKKSARFQGLAKRLDKPVVKPSTSRTWLAATRKDGQTMKRVAARFHIDVGAS